MQPSLSQTSQRIAKPFDDPRLWWLLLLILSSRLALLLLARWLPGDDGLRYLQEALNLRDYGVFSSDSPPGVPGPSAFDLPVFPFLMSLLLRITPDVASAMRIAAAANAVCFTGACALLFGITRMLSGQASLSLLTVALLAAFPETWPYSLFHMPDSLFVLVFLASIFLLVRFLRSAKLSDLLFAFALLACSTMIKPASLYFGVIFAFCSLLFWPRQEPLLRRFFWVLCGFAIQAVLFCPWIVRNQIAFGHPILTTITGVNYFRENYRMLLEDTRPAEAKSVLIEQEQAAKLQAGARWDNPAEQAAFMGAVANRELKNHFGAYLKTVVKRHPRLYAGTGCVALLRLLGDTADTAALETWQSHPSLSGARALPWRVLILQLFTWGVLALAYLAALVGTVFLVRRQAWLPLALTVLPLLYFAAAVGPMTYTRYRMPMAPFFALLAAYGLSAVFSSRRAHLT